VGRTRAIVRRASRRAAEGEYSASADDRREIPDLFPLVLRSCGSKGQQRSTGRPPGQTPRLQRPPAFADARGLLSCRDRRRATECALHAKKRAAWAQAQRRLRQKAKRTARTRGRLR